MSKFKSINNERTKFIVAAKKTLADDFTAVIEPTAISRGKAIELLMEIFMNEINNLPCDIDKEVYTICVIERMQSAVKKITKD